MFIFSTLLTLVAIVAVVMVLGSWSALKVVENACDVNKVIRSSAVGALYLKMYAVNTRLVTDIENKLDRDERGNYYVTSRWHVKQSIENSRFLRFLTLFGVLSLVSLWSYSFFASLVFPLAGIHLYGLDSRWCTIAVSNLDLIAESHSNPPNTIDDDDDFDGKGY